MSQQRSPGQKETFLSARKRGAAVGLLLVLVIGLCVRIGVLAALPDALRDDPDGYRAVAENLLQHGVLGHRDRPTAIRPPLYPLVLAGCGVFGAGAWWALAGVQVLMGLATIGLTWALARQCRLPGWSATFAGGLVACDPILLRASSLVMTETLSALLAAWVLYLWCRWVRGPRIGRAALLGGVLALGALCRPEWLLGVFVVGGVLAAQLFSRSAGLSQTASFFSSGTGSHTTRLGKWMLLGAYMGAAGLVLAPWGIRNALVLGRPILTTTHGGYTLLLANNRWLYEHLQQGGSLSTWDPGTFHQTWAQAVQRFQQDQRPPAPSGPLKETPSGFQEILADLYASHQAIQTIWENPGTFCRAALLRWGRLWQVAPHRIEGIEFPQYVYWGILLWYCAEFVLAIWGIYIVLAKRRKGFLLRNTLLLALLGAALLTGIHTLYWTDMRMRAPLTSGIALAVAAALPGRKQRCPSTPLVSPS